LCPKLLLAEEEAYFYCLQRREDFSNIATFGGLLFCHADHAASDPRASGSGWLRNEIIGLSMQNQAAANNRVCTAERKADVEIIELRVAGFIGGDIAQITDVALLRIRAGVRHAFWIKMRTGCIPIR
jgi:hypothetical protein